MLLENNFISDKPKFFGRRKGRVIRKAKSTLLETFLPEIKITDQTKLDKDTLFGVPVEEICLEIGFGSGDHLAGQALNNPRRGYIGAEVFQNGVANLLTLITGIKEGTNLPEKSRCCRAELTISEFTMMTSACFLPDCRMLFWIASTCCSLIPGQKSATPPAAL